MGIQTKELELTSPSGETFTYKVTQFGAIVGRREFVKLANLLGPAFRLAGNVEAGLGNLLSNLDPAELDRICTLYAGQTRVTGGSFEDKTPLLKDVFDTHFAGNYCDMFEWLVFCIVTNYSSFFSGIEALVKKYTPEEPVKAEKTSASQ
jgi:hypothetical protein